MPEGDRPAVDVQLGGVDRQLSQTGQHLGRERLVQLDEIDVVEGEPGARQRLPDRGHRSDPETLRLHAGGGVGDESGERLEPGPLGPFPRRDHDGGGAVAHLRRVAGGHRALDVKRGPQAAEDLQRRIAARPFVGGEREGPHRRATVVAVRRLGHLYLERHDLVLEAPGVNRGERALVAAQGERVLLVARDPGLAGVVLGDEPGREIDVRIVLHQGRVRSDLVPAHRDEAHRLGPAGDDGVGPAHHDPLRPVGDRLQAGRAEPVDGDRGRLDRDAGAEAGDAGDVHALLALGHGAAENDVLHLARFDAGSPFQRLGDHRRRQLVGSRGAQGAPGRLPDRGANRRHDHCISQNGSPSRLMAGETRTGPP